MENLTYKTIYADPPWNEVGGGKIKRGADKHYPLMKTKDIIIVMQGVLINQIDKNAHLYLWATNNHLPDALEVISALDFRYITCITWFKEGRYGLGQYFRGKTEHCLFAVKGTLPYKVHPETGKRIQGVTGFMAPRQEHSVKPIQMREMIEKVSYGPYLELFARGKLPENWDGWGLEYEGS